MNTKKALSLILLVSLLSQGNVFGMFKSGSKLLNGVRSSTVHNTRVFSKVVSFSRFSTTNKLKNIELQKKLKKQNIVLQKKLKKQDQKVLDQNKKLVSQKEKLKKRDNVVDSLCKDIKESSTLEELKGFTEVCADVYVKGWLGTVGLLGSGLACACIFEAVKNLF